MACFIYEVSSSMTATVLWVVNKTPATLKEMPSRTDMEEVIGHWIATTTAAMKLAWQDPHTATQCRVKQRVHEFIAETNLFEWLTKQNFQRCCTIILEHGDTVGPRLALERNTQGEQSSKHFFDRQRKHQTHLGTTSPSSVGIENWQASRGTGHLSLGDKNPDMYQKRDPIVGPNNDPNSWVAHSYFCIRVGPKNDPKIRTQTEIIFQSKSSHNCIYNG